MKVRDGEYSTGFRVAAGGPGLQYTAGLLREAGQQPASLTASTPPPATEREREREKWTVLVKLPVTSLGDRPVLLTHRAHAVHRAPSALWGTK